MIAGVAFLFVAGVVIGIIDRRLSVRERTARWLDRGVVEGSRRWR